MLVALGCQKQSKLSDIRFEQPFNDESVSGVAFDVKSSDNQNAWLCTYAKGGAVAKFRLELNPSPCSTPQSVNNFETCSGKGKLIAERGSNPRELLHDLQAALKAKNLPAHVERVNELPFKYVRFGDNMSRTPQGGFISSPSGGWIATKLFLGTGKDEGQVFLNLNPEIGKGEFSMKDEEYGDFVLAKLARVL